MPEQKNEAHPAAARSISPTRQLLLSSDKEELVERIEFLQAELQRRMDAEEELLHANYQRGTASLQAQVEEASRRFKVAQQELEAFRLEILQAEGDPAGSAPRPYIYEDLSEPPQEGPDRNQLRSLLTSFRRLRDDRDRLKREIEGARGELATEKARSEKAAAELATLGVAAADFNVVQSRLHQEIEAAHAEIERLRATPAPKQEEPAPRREEPDEEIAALRRERADLEEQRDRLEQEKADARGETEQVRLELDRVRDVQARASEEAVTLRAAAADLDAEADRLKQDVARLESESSSHLDEQAQLGRNLAYEQAKTERLAVESRELVARLATTARLLEEARFELENPKQSVGFEQLEKFLEKVRLKALLEKNVRGPRRKDQPPAPDLLVEIVGATIGAQEEPLEGARNLLPRIHRPKRMPGLGELRQFIETLKTKEVAGVKRVHDLLRTSFFTGSKKPEPMPVDLDTLELLVDQQPNASTSYWPLVLFVPELQEFWHGELRLSAENSPKEIADFVAEGLDRAPSTLDKSKFLLRMDARFYSDALLRVLESKKCSYVMAAPESAELRAEARACAYADAGDGWQAGEWVRKGRGSKIRFVSLRHGRKAQPTPSLPFTFRDPHHAYHVFAVDGKIAPRRALEVYAAREASQSREHALLRDVAVNRLLARGAEAHATFLPLFLLSADLLQWYRRGLK